MDLTPLNTPWAAVDGPGRIEIVDRTGQIVAHCWDDDHAARIVLAVNERAQMEQTPC